MKKISDEQIYEYAGRNMAIVDYARGIDLDERTPDDLTQQDCINNENYSKNRVGTEEIQQLFYRLTDRFGYVSVHAVEAVTKWDAQKVYLAYRDQVMLMTKAS